jgi:DNA (cytosine-5)-methyltransferase 1
MAKSCVLRPGQNAPKGVLSALELCAGGGGQSLGLKQAEFHCVAAVEIDPDACKTLRNNLDGTQVVEGDLRTFDARRFEGIDLVAGGVPCPPFSIAGKQLGASDERDLFPEALRIVREADPRAVMLENVRGFCTEKFSAYRQRLLSQFRALGYVPAWRLLQASDYGVPQLRPRFLLVALKEEFAPFFSWPECVERVATVGETLLDLMAAGGWPGADGWAANARSIAPTIVGGSKKHGGPDLGPTRARADWKKLGVNGISLAAEPPGPEFPVDGFPRLTNRMVARLQSFPDSWEFSGTKTAQYRQIGNAFPPAVALAVAARIRAALLKRPVPLVTGGELFGRQLVAGS